MADIVQLKENGVGQYVMTHPDAIVGLDENIKKAINSEKKASDSGWINAATAGVVNEPNAQLQYRKISNKVTFRGGGKFQVTSNFLFLILPASFKPSREIRCESLVQDSNTAHKCIFRINANGECRIIYNSSSSNICYFDNIYFYTD